MNIDKTKAALGTHDVKEAAQQATTGNHSTRTLHMPDQGNSPGVCFWMGWSGSSRGVDLRNPK
eukprot:2552437-Pyramimonas_sp.AAC.1